jgi:predicted nucleic acid-binding protein
MRVLLDTNVVLDALLSRDPWVAEAQMIWAANEEGRLVGHVLASALTDIFYVARRLAGLERARVAVTVCLQAFEICPVDRQALEEAQAMPGNDFEDNLQMTCARLSALDAIVTRDPKGFQDSTLPVLTPAELLEQLNSS